MTMETSENVFEKLNKVDLKGKIKTKNKLKYLPWSSAWAIVKQSYPNARYKIIPQIMDEKGNIRPWHDDGKTGWVQVRVIINDIEHDEILAIMDFKNQSIPADKITSTDANKSIKRCLVKACAMHGLGMYIYEGEELPAESLKLSELRSSIGELVKKKCSQSDEAKIKVGELCKAAEKKANPDLPDDAITGDYNNIEDTEILQTLKRQILAVRK